MQVRELLPLFELMRSQRVNLYGMPEGKYLANLDKPAIQKRLLGGENDPQSYMSAEVLYADANSTAINIMVKWPNRR